MSKEKKTSYFLRAKLPAIFRVLAVIGFAVAILAVGFGLYKARDKKTFRMKGAETKLSKEIEAVVQGYERRETENGQLKYFIKADRATTFTDKHQEFENVYLEVYDRDDPELVNKISAENGISVPAKDETKNIKVFLAGKVKIDTHFKLNVETDQLTYDTATEIADAEELIEFERENIKGKSLGAIVNVKNQTLDLLKDVEIDTFASDNDEILSETNIKSAKLKAGKAFVNQKTERIKLEQGAEIYLIPKSEGVGNLNQPTDIKSNQATAYFKNKEIRKLELNGNVDIFQKQTGNNRDWTKAKAQKAIALVDKELKTLELIEGVIIETTSNNSSPTLIKSNQAFYEKDADIFKLTDKVEIVTVRDSKPTRIKASQAIYEQSSGKVFLTGNSEVNQGTDFVLAESINAVLNINKKLRSVEAFGGAVLRQETNERITLVKASELNATFNQEQNLQKANAIGNSDVLITPKNNGEYNEFAIFAPKEINLGFRGDGTLSDLRTQGRTTIRLNAKNNTNDAADKKLTADTIKTTLRNNGQEIATARASGNARLIVEPLRNRSENYRSVIESSSFDCEFFAGNNAKSCVGNSQSKVTRVPTIKGQETQILSSDSMIAFFDKKTQDIEKFQAVGKAKFNEGDRNGIADRINYTADNGLVTLNGNSPTVWDSNGRAKAGSIEWDTKAEKSILSGGVSTTYYSQNNTGGTTPFTSVNSPVFLTSNRAIFNHLEKNALYTGNARAWQGKNYVRAEKLFLEQNEERMFAEGKVESIIYDVNQTIAGKKTKTSVFVSSERLLYQNKLKLIRYENQVDIRQGSDRITAGLANIFLNKSNEITKSIIKTDIVITQPNRRVTGDFAQYTAADESVYLRGNPARVFDSEKGSSQGREVTVYLKDKRVIGSGSETKNGSGRIRTVYKVKNGKIN
jgi:lipopolysaccharide export system protein LptA